MKLEYKILESNKFNSVNSVLDNHFKISTRLRTKLIKNKHIMKNGIVCDSREMVKLGDIIKVKNESIPSIFKNILYLKKEEKLEEEDLKQLDEMEKILSEYLQKIEIMEKRYEETINNYFINFLYFFKLLKEITDTFA